MNAIVYQDETKVSVKSHREGHRPEFLGRRATFYELFGGKCPICGIVPEFETVEFKTRIVK